MSSQSIELRGAVYIDQMQPQFAATIATNSDGFFPVAGESAFWLEVKPGIVINRLMDVALKSCEVKPGALVTERSYGTLEVHGPDNLGASFEGDRLVGRTSVRFSRTDRPGVYRVSGTDLTSATRDRDAFPREGGLGWHR